MNILQKERALFLSSQGKKKPTFLAYHKPLTGQRRQNGTCFNFLAESCMVTLFQTVLKFKAHIWCAGIVRLFLTKAVGYFSKRVQIVCEIMLDLNAVISNPSETKEILGES